MIEIIVGVATWYAGAYVGGPLYCGGTYAESTAPWVALPARDLGRTWECGDLVYLSFGDGTSLLARALDAGPFGAFCVIEGDRCVPIVADVPRHLVTFSGRSSPVRVVNVTRECRESGRCD